MTLSQVARRSKALGTRRSDVFEVFSPKAQSYAGNRHILEGSKDEQLFQRAVLEARGAGRCCLAGREKPSEVDVAEKAVS